MRVTTIHSTVALWVVRVFVVVRARANGAPSGRCLPHQSGSLSDRGWRSAPKPASPPFNKAPKKIRGTAVWVGEGANLRRIRAGIGACDPSWSPDGRRLAVTAAEGLWVFPANSSDGALRVESRLPLGSIEFNYRAFSSPRWSPDGVLLGLVVTNGGTSWVEVFEANSGRLFYTSPPEHDTFSWTAARELKLGALEIHLSQR